jgi:hypothetical protein
MQVAKSEGEACRGKEEDTLESSGNVAVIIIIDGVAYSCLYVHHEGYSTAACYRVIGKSTCDWCSMI